jgi:N-carbamoylputrescine amidase
MPLVASNRSGVEAGDSCTLTFYGSSFIAGPSGEIVACAEREGEALLTATFDLQAIAQQRAAWGLFRDRRPEHYASLCSLDGKAHG